ncbi:symmetrical bis(5'-nucleosyl)-tetraphosphatase [Limnohabitans sp. Jir72]|uniref:symmetrical bis(5'-nucleosyl)-tetraphosphatase n=1 Tax=Limnohabitans sp. Jir72 TaxID=1977909 RepID=UPI000D37949D|nr:symmetrical bis(5'-nucleosyl)-tetraphosphatase [Limnohabitans sp. Jir72]PUE34498.1 bis(5'-nucleosyl)-tetraphosphatase (symmetrical) [Limnohabitans sp. Jir72]
MSVYLIGDIQGCDGALERLLQQVAFSPSRDQLYVLGDLVNRGPDSAGVLRRLMAIGSSVQCVLGNHDLHLLAVAAGCSPSKRLDTLDDLLQAPDRNAMLDWLRHQRMAIFEHGILMVHAGVLPTWSVDKTLALAAEFEAVLCGPQLTDFLRQMYGNQPEAWREDLQGNDRLRVIVNALTRLRFCSTDGVMEFKTKEAANAAPKGFMPWFDVPGRQTAHVPVAFGHWSTLGWLGRPDVLALDTGCVWGGCLSALRLRGNEGHELIQVKCSPAQQVG